MKKTLFIATLLEFGTRPRNDDQRAVQFGGHGDVERRNAYSWAFRLPLPTGQTSPAAQIDFTKHQIDFCSGSTGALWTDLLKSTNTGVTTAVDNDRLEIIGAPKFLWSEQSTITFRAMQGVCAVGTTLTWS